MAYPLNFREGDCKDAGYIANFERPGSYRELGIAFGGRREQIRPLDSSRSAGWAEKEVHLHIDTLTRKLRMKDIWKIF